MKQFLRRTSVFAVSPAGCAVITRRLRFILPLSCFALLLTSNIAQASTLYSNPVDLSNNQGGDCTFNSVCGNTSDTFVAQKFTLAASSTITGGGYNVIQFGGPGSSADYILYNADPVTKLPGTEIAFGTSSLTESVGPTGNANTTDNYSFVIPSLTLAAGSYYLAVHEETSSYGDYLSFGTASKTTAAESSDGGVTYYPGYNTGRSGAISVFGTTGVAPTPEPNTLCLLGTGLAGITALRRRFRRA